MGVHSFRLTNQIMPQSPEANHIVAAELFLFSTAF